MKKERVSSSKDVGEGLGISGLTLGVLGILFSGILFSGIVGIGISIPGLVFSLIQQKKNKTRIGFAGVILNSIAIISSILFLIFIYYQGIQLI